MTDTFPDLLLPDPRIAVLLPTGFTDVDTLLSVITHPSWQEQDPELVLLRTSLLQEHCLDDFLRDHYWLSTSFVVPSPCTASWEVTMDEILTYATHLLVVWDREPSALSAYLKTTNRPQRPTKLIMV